ncbi:hypothetical protein ACH3VR_08255 [Microbacterium sp. B2969]|uniref:Uncharacterized protein n=1 Tax=Microbacterium alkaliflavum TaxID=3248839 RepID=A0ABW7Q661_9MICO
MGLFTQRPEEDNEDWTGLPSEPAREETAAERLPDAPPAGGGAWDLFGASGSVVIPVAHVADEPEDDDEPVEDADSDADDPTP